MHSLYDCNDYNYELLIIMKAFEHLSYYNIKPSVQRLAIMEYLMDHRTHPTVDEIYSNLNVTMPTLSRTTIYNTLRLFSEQGAAQMLTIDEKMTCYDADVSPHAHFLCKRCGGVFDLPLKEAQKESDERGFGGHSVTEIHYYYKGICKDCLKNID